MTEENQSISDAAKETPVEDPGSENADQVEKKDSVQYDTYRKVLSEKKKMQEKYDQTQKRLAELESKAKENEEKELQEQNRWQELAKKKEEEAQDALNKVHQYEQREIASRKLDKVLSKVGDPIDSKYWGLINIDAVEYDAENGSFDETSLNAEVQRIKNEMPEIISRKSSANYDPSAPIRNGSGQMSPVEFARLSKDEKKRKLDSLSGAPEWMRGKF